MKLLRAHLTLFQVTAARSSLGANIQREATAFGRVSLDDAEDKERCEKSISAALREDGP